jgi:hypothetical protein
MFVLSGDIFFSHLLNFHRYCLSTYYEKATGLVEQYLISKSDNSSALMDLLVIIIMLDQSGHNPIKGQLLFIFFQILLV